jgi:hypothetical protein
LAILGQLKPPKDGESSVEWNSYIAFCDFIAPSLLEKKIFNRGPRDVRSRPVKKGLISTPSYETLRSWTQWSQTSAINEITVSYLARTQGAEQEQFSVYCKPRLHTLSHEFVKGFSIAKDNQHHSADENIMGTTSRVLATMFAKQQMPSAHAQRMKMQNIHLAAHEDTTQFWNHVHSGTALPKPSTSTNDVHKFKFEYPPYTGIWWDETMQNAGLCDGILKLFLLQSNLKPDITHYEFFTAMLKPYLAHKKISENVYGGPTMSGLHKNAWNVPVLDKSNCFEFASTPLFDQQQGTFDGIDVGVCMRLTHYVLFQGLGFTKDWNVEQHENAEFVSCVHLRNMSSISLGYLSLLLHTSCDKAMIPANSGKLHLPAPSPLYGSCDEAVIEYDSRLHVDTHHHQMQGVSDNVLCVSARIATNKNWTLLDFSNSQSALWYSHVLSDNQRMSKATSRAFLFPFPPEAVAHIAFMMDDMLLANRKYIELLQKERLDKQIDEDIVEDEVESIDNGFAQAMLYFGESIRFEDYQHKQPSLTQCVIQDQREILCVTCQFGYLFTIKFADGVMMIKSCHRTHAWEQLETCEKFEPFLPLPLHEEQEDGCVLPSSQFCHFFRHGLCLRKAHDDSPVVVVDLTYKEIGKRLPFYMFPIAHYPVLLLLQHSGWFNTKSGMFLNNLEFFKAKHQQMYVVRDCQETWVQENVPAVRSLYAQCKARVPDLSMHACFVDETSLHVLEFWAESEGQIAYFSTQEQISQQLSENIFMNDTAFFRTLLQSSKASSSYLMLYHPEYGLSHVRYDAVDASQLVANFYYHGSCGSLLDRRYEFAIDMTDYNPRFLPAGSDTTMGEANMDYQWGITTENAHGSFLADGCYTVSSEGEHPVDKTQIPVTFSMDFINMSRCMMIEGSQIWIHVTEQIYANLRSQAHEQGYEVMLPITQELHNSMHGLRFLRGFYILGGSLHDSPISDNTVRVICIIAKQGVYKRNLVDDNAGIDSPVNYTVPSKDLRFVAFTLPIKENNGSCIITRDRDDKTPFYKYLRALNTC